MSKLTAEMVKPVRFVETRNRTPKSLSYAESLGDILQTIGTTIGSPDAFLSMRQFLANIATNPQLTTVDCWYTEEELDAMKSPRRSGESGLGLRPVLVLPYSAESTEQPVNALCVSFEDNFSQFGLDIVGTIDNSIIDASTTSIVPTSRIGNPVGHIPNIGRDPRLQSVDNQIENPQ